MDASLKRLSLGCRPGPTAVQDRFQGPGQIGHAAGDPHVAGFSRHWVPRSDRVRLEPRPSGVDCRICTKPLLTLRAMGFDQEGHRVASHVPDLVDPLSRDRKDLATKMQLLGKRLAELFEIIRHNISATRMSVRVWPLSASRFEPTPCGSDDIVTQFKNIGIWFQALTACTTASPCSRIRGTFPPFNKYAAAASSTGPVPRIATVFVIPPSLFC